jgi:hypothetical protein
MGHRALGFGGKIHDLVGISWESFIALNWNFFNGVLHQNVLRRGHSLGHKSIRNEMGPLFQRDIFHFSNVIYNLGQMGGLRRHKSQSPHMGLQLGTFGHLLKCSIVHTLVLKGRLVNLVGFLELFFDVTKT